jgi:hypothetical protein
MALSALAMTAALRLISPPPAEPGQRRQARITQQDHTPTTPTITPIWPAARHVLLPPKAHNTIATVARRYFYLYPINHTVHLNLEHTLCTRII